MKNNSFLSNCTSGGCGAKIAPGELSELLNALPKLKNDRLLVGYDASDDAAVYKIDNTNSLISTVDFFSPMVDDPYIFGKIAASNALSDVWAMGGQPILALNMVCFPESMDKKFLAEILAGGSEKIAEAGAVLGGGHSIYDKEPKYGLAVTGLVETKKLLRNNTPQIGHSLILTKALGVGIIMAAARVGLAEKNSVENAIKSMERLNGYAAAKLSSYNVSACTDITGFGLLAHTLEMASNVTLCISTNSLPILTKAESYANEYLITAAGQRNRTYTGVNVDKLPFALQELLFDPQTSGGLLIAVDSTQAHSLLNDIRHDDPVANIIGEVLPAQADPIIFI